MVDMNRAKQLLALSLTLVAGTGRAVTSPGAASPTGAIVARSGPRFEHLYDIPFPGGGLPMSMIRDASDRPFLYVASKEAGLRIYDVTESPRLVRSIPTSELERMHVMNVTQHENRLYLALGDHWGRGRTPQSGAGLAVIDVRDPGRARVAGVWKDADAGGGGGAVAVKGPVAYLAAMGSGLIVLDVSDPMAIRVLARLQPDPAFPDARPDRKKINARAVTIRDDLLFLCYDAGGVRVLDVADPKRPVEVGRYANPAMNGRPRAYNNIALNGTLAYVTVDYVGLEVLDISNPRAIKPVSWWNPWNPQLDGWRWFSSPGHANEIAYDARRGIVLMSAGRTDLVAVDVSDPARPRQVGSIGEVDDAKATWGLSMHGDRVYLSYIRTLGIPFRADWAGIKVFRYRP
jgi:hypothetical protein